ncbi:MAG: ion transporter [Planctomycetes bacterium]|nr:ion transporter [Planctomycetota bacterium]
MADDATQFKRNTPGMLRLKSRLYDVVFEQDTAAGILFDGVVLLLIFFSVTCIVLESYSDLREEHGAFFDYSEVLVVAIFTIEYLLRMWLCTLPMERARFDENERLTMMDRLRVRVNFFFRPMSQVDLWAILPFYIIAWDLRVLRLVRAVRLIRLLKLARYFDPLEALVEVFREKGRTFIIFLFVVFIGLLINATALHIVEAKGAAGSFENIPSTLWWCILRLGQGGRSLEEPATDAGRFLAAAMIIIFRIGIVCVFGGIFAAAFIQRMLAKASQVCPKDECGLRDIPADADFCPLCGARLTEMEDCCRQNEKWAKFCRFCGKPLKAQRLP